MRGLEVFGIDQLYQALYPPDLVQEKLVADAAKNPSGVMVSHSPCGVASKLATNSPVARFQIPIVPSELPESTCRPSDENAMELTGPECPVKVRSKPPSLASHSLIVVSLLPESTCRPSDEKATELT